MALVDQVRVAWGNFPGQPAVSTFYFGTADAVQLGNLKSFFDAMTLMLPSGTTITYPSSGMRIDTSTGQPVSAWSATPPAASTMTGTSSYSGVSGAVVNWKTGVFLNGREVRGKTFLVPLVVGCYDTTGTINNTNLGQITAAATTLAGRVGGPQVYSRKYATVAPMTGVSVPDKAVVLRSRRL